MPNLVASCPSCSGDLAVTRLRCETCETELQGTFSIPPLLRLSREDLAFVVSFIRESGSLKAMAEHTGTSYPTVRNRLNDIIRQLEHAERHIEQKRHEILDALERGELTADAAARALRKVGP